MDEENEPEPEVRLRVVVDGREGRSGLPEAVASVWPRTFAGRLPVGDVEIGPRVLVERKTVSDFVLSLEDGRLFRQAMALTRTSVSPLLVVEGEDPFDAARLPPEALRGVLLTLLVGYRLPILRTGSLEETALSVARIARHEERRLARRETAEPARPTAARRAMEILASIPGVGDRRARKLLSSFGSVAAVTAAPEEDLLAAPGIGPATARAIRESCGVPPLPAPPDPER
jgi:Fanconi anemia group M protein